MTVIRKLWQTKKEPWFLKDLKDYGGHNIDVLWTPNLDEAMKFQTLNKAITFFNINWGFVRFHLLRWTFRISQVFNFQAIN